MNIFLLNQFYPPDRAPTGQYLHDLARTLIAQGHQVTVIASSGGYEAGGTVAVSGTRDGVRVVRVPAWSFGRGRVVGRLADYVSYVLLAWRRGVLLTPAPDLVVSLTTPPFLGLIGRWIARHRGCPHAHWVMDVYPDALAAAGVLSPRSWAYRVLAWLARLQWHDAGSVLALGPCMAQRLAEHLGGRVPPWVPLWILPAAHEQAAPEAIAAMRQARGWDGWWVVAYTGNLGRGHDVTGLVAALGRMSVADGAGAGAMSSLPLLFAVPDTPAGRAIAAQALIAVPGVRVVCVAPAHERDVSAHIAAADLQVVAVGAGWEGIVVPSKLQGVMAAGRPTLVLAAAASEAAQWVTAAGAGWCVAPDDVAGIAAALQEASDATERARRGAAARVWATTWYDPRRRTHQVAQWCVSAASVHAEADNLSGA